MQSLGQHYPVRDKWGILLKVVGKAQATKSNLRNFRYRCLVVALIDVSEVLSQTLHACMSYERKKNLKIM